MPNNMPNLPPYTPPRPPNNRPPSPTIPLEELFRAPTAVVGCELIVRGVSPRSGQTAADVVRKAVQDATTSSTDFTLRIRDRELYKVLIATAGSRAERDSYCYVRIAPDVAVASSDPRPDLLAQWIEVIPTLNSQWSVDWSPQRAGKDKSTWVSLQGISNHDGDA